MYQKGVVLLKVGQLCEVRCFGLEDQLSLPILVLIYIIYLAELLYGSQNDASPLNGLVLTYM